jgi:hypothetical protein
MKDFFLFLMRKICPPPVFVPPQPPRREGETLNPPEGGRRGVFYRFLKMFLFKKIPFFIENELNLLI